MSNEKPVIEFKGYRITNIDFKVYNPQDEIEQLDIIEGELHAAIGINDDFSQALIRLDTVVIDKSNLRVISVEISGQFDINESDKEKAKHYLQTNGTAILMPYLRTVVSILSSLDNENSIILPTINTNSFHATD